MQFKVVPDHSGISDWTYKNSSIVSELEHKVYEITYVINGWGLKNGFVAFGIREKEGEEV